MKFSEMLEEYLNHRDVVRHVFTSLEVRGDRMDQKEHHKKRMEELAKVMDKHVAMNQYGQGK